MTINMNGLAYSVDRPSAGKLRGSGEPLVCAHHKLVHELSM